MVIQLKAVKGTRNCLFYFTAGAKSGVLQKVELPLVNNRECGEMYKDMGSETSLNRGITSNMLCAGDLSGGRDTCSVSSNESFYLQLYVNPMFIQI